MPELWTLGIVDAMNEVRFKIPELRDFPPEKQEAVLRRCLDSQEFVRKAGVIRWVCLLLAVAGLITTISISGSFTGDGYLWTGLVVVGGVVIFIPLMIFAQMWLRVRLVRKLVRREVADA